MSDPGTADEDVQVTVKLDQQSMQEIRSKYPVARDNSDAVRYAVQEVLSDDDPEIQLTIVDDRGE